MKFLTSEKSRVRVTPGSIDTQRRPFRPVSDSGRRLPRGKQFVFLMGSGGGFITLPGKHFSKLLDEAGTRSSLLNRIWSAPSWLRTIVGIPFDLSHASAAAACQPTLRSNNAATIAIAWVSLGPELLGRYRARQNRDERKLWHARSERGYRRGQADAGAQRSGRNNGHASGV